MSFSPETRKRIEELVAHLNHLRDQKLDFPTIWQDHLKNHRLVMSIPVQVLLGDKPGLEILLVNGGRLRFDSDRFHLR